MEIGLKKLRVLFLYVQFFCNIKSTNYADKVNKGWKCIIIYLWMKKHITIQKYINFNNIIRNLWPFFPYTNYWTEAVRLPRFITQTWWILQLTIAGFPTFMRGLLNILHLIVRPPKFSIRLKNKQSQKQITLSKPTETVKLLPLNHQNRCPTEISPMMHYVRSKKGPTNPPLLFLISSIYYFYVRLVLVG